jgi:hypothetical protein
MQSPPQPPNRDFQSGVAASETEGLPENNELQPAVEPLTHTIPAGEL